MNPHFKRARAVVALAVVALVASPFVAPPAAHAAGSLVGAASVKTAGGAADMASGDSASTFTLRLPAAAACPGDSPNDNYRWQTFMVPASVDPGTLTFGSNGPLPAAVGASFRQPLFTTTGSPIVNKQTAAADTPGGPGPIINIQDMSYGVFSPGDIPAGAYNIGIACTLGAAGPTQMSSYWNVQKTFTTNAAGGPAQVDWAVGANPQAPALTALAPGDGTLTATFTHAASSPATSLFTVTATPTAGGAAITATSATVAPTVVSGLTNGAEYSVTVRATNAVGDSAESNALTDTPNPAPRPAVENLTATPGTGEVDLSWSAPASGPAPTGYSVSVSPAEGSMSVSGTTASITGLTAGTTYTFTVTPQHPAPYVGTPASVLATPFDSQVLIQDITVTRPVGAIVLTQVCGKHGAVPEDVSGTPGFPAGSLPAIPASAAVSHTGPTLTAGGTDTDPKYTAGQYPFPAAADGSPEPSYPTHCGIALGTAQLVRTGSGAGKFFAASGLLSQVTVVDTRDTDTGWTVTGTMSAFTAGAGKTFSGSQLGWSPLKTSDTDPFTDSDGTSYDQVVTAGPVVAANSPVATGLSAGRTLGSAAGLAGTAPTLTGGLGVAELDGRLKLLIPITAKAGTYLGTLTITATGA